VELQSPYLLHSKLGAYLAKEKYGVEDEEILSAIRWHTTGRPNMTMLEKIIFTADYIEPARFKAKNLVHIRWLAFHDLNQAVYQILEDTLHYLDSGKGEIDEMSRSAYRYYHNLYDETDDKGDSLTV
jgi:predicted HD superfamily hydrolase involved in NAD metabolism